MADLHWICCELMNKNIYLLIDIKPIVIKSLSLRNKGAHTDRRSDTANHFSAVNVLTLHFKWIIKSTLWKTTNAVNRWQP